MGHGYLSLTLPLIKREKGLLQTRQVTSHLDISMKMKYKTTTDCITHVSRIFSHERYISVTVLSNQHTCNNITKVIYCYVKHTLVFWFVSSLKESVCIPFTFCLQPQREEHDEPVHRTSPLSALTIPDQQRQRQLCSPIVGPIIKPSNMGHKWGARCHGQSVDMGGRCPPHRSPTAATAKHEGG